MDNTSNDSPSTSTPTVRTPTPFHSFNTMPHTLLNNTFNDMRILHEKAIITLPGVKKLCPAPKPKNCEYHSSPAKAQNSRLFAHTRAGEAV